MALQRFHPFAILVHPMKRLTHDQIAARRLTPEAALTADRTAIYGLLDNIRSLYNVGSIFRTSDGALISGLYLCGYTPHPPRREIEKTALGATGTVPWWYLRDPMEAIAELKKRGVTICALEHTTASIPYTEVSADRFPLCLIVGNELTGVSPALLDAADMAIEIPMFGTKQSLNVAVAYGVAAFHLTTLARKNAPGGM
jgi:tRNA G18 (ribose-2'-O)-methylase SpoU